MVIVLILATTHNKMDINPNIIDKYNIIVKYDRFALNNIRSSLKYVKAM